MFRIALAFVVLVCAPALAVADTLATFNTVLGQIHVQLFDDTTPITVDNFLTYAADGDYDQTFIHRNAPGFVVQGGGFSYTESPFTVSAIPTAPPITNEFQKSNTRGTIAMARLGGQPNSATSQWFFNVANNTGLDTVDGGFTVFGQVLGNDMDVVDAIAAVQKFAYQAPFGELPLLDFTTDDYLNGVPVTAANLVAVHSITYSLLGDANGDDKIDIFDIAAVSQNWGNQGGAGDVNFDGEVDIFDVAMVSQNWGETPWTPAAVAAVPEPSTLALFVAAAIAFCCWRRSVGGRRRA